MTYIGGSCEDGLRDLLYFFQHSTKLKTSISILTKGYNTALKIIINCKILHIRHKGPGNA
ncbi:hypothetical protein AU255_06985 [Methyloprofundus sedimenti]|uniref:Uncharacterized protein n=1 Tax=Methyloprofundus sedimenti TaxID=1420851 RepID=A0A1V8M7W9_9GAMM|nr:hypothetical protein AU255_06985 [Methyloprofundus sedimenti]